MKGAQVVKWGKIPGVTGWSEDPLGHRRTGDTKVLCCSQVQELGSWLRSAGLGASFLV